MYSFSWEPNPNWNYYYGRREEIFAYLKHCVKKYSIMNHVMLDHDVIDAKWLDEDQMWQITSSQGTYFSRFFVNGQGFLSDPRITFPGKERFKGNIFHSAQWDHNCDLTGKRVAVIGTGASAIQFVPGIVDKAKEVIIFQRSAPWVIPRDDFTIPNWVKKLFYYVPAIQRLCRACIYWSHEVRKLITKY
jgi:cation diffusion facilitator CzcD-associated flavoprotein CzcO